MTSPYMAWRDRAVNDVATVEEFLDRCYKPDRYKDRGEEYAAALLQSHKRDLDRYGVDWISHHDSVTGRVVAFYDPEFAVLADRILSVMEPGRWYLPQEVKRAAGINRTNPHYGDILTRMCEASILIHGNGITTSGFCRPE